MANNILQNLATELSETFLRQIIAFGLVLIIAWLLQYIIRRLLDRTETNLAQIPWADRLVKIVRAVLWPLLARIISQIAITGFQELEWETSFLGWATFFIGLWLFYRFFDALLQVSLSATQAEVWSGKIVLPIVLGVGVLQGIGLLDDILDWTLTPRRDIQITVGSVLAGLATLAFFIILSRGTSRYLERTFLPQVQMGRALTEALSTLINYLVVVIGVMIALSVTGIDLTTLTIIAGGLSVGLGFGLQEIVSNFLSGFILMFEQSIGPGDVLKIGDSMGVVQNIGVRSMTIKTRDNIELIVPNSKFLTEIVTNLTRTENLVRVRVGVGVTYSADPREVEEALLEAAEHPRILSEPAPRVHFIAFGDSSLNFDLLVWTRDAARVGPLASDLRYRIWDALKAHQIEIPFPQRDLHLRSGVPWEQLTSGVDNNSHG